MFGYKEQLETVPGKWEDVITEKLRLGNVEQRTEAFRAEGSIHPEYRTTTSVSVPSEGPKKVSYSDLAYVTYAGIRWVPSSIVVEPPKLTVFIGEEYHGPTPEAP